MAERKQVLKNEINYLAEEGFYEIRFFVNNKKLACVNFEQLVELVCFRELLANLPTLKSKLELLLEGSPKQWFSQKLADIDRRARNEKKASSNKIEEKENFDLESYLAKFNL